jgi:hypothetical protein
LPYFLETPASAGVFARGRSKGEDRMVLSSFIAGFVDSLAAIIIQLILSLFFGGS